MALLANESWTHGDFFQQKKLKTVEDGSCRVVEACSCRREVAFWGRVCGERWGAFLLQREGGDAFPREG